MEIYYRYSEFRTSESMSLHLETFEVLKYTQRGVWLDYYGGGKKFVLNEARKRFACPTKEEALESFRARKKRQIKILKAQLHSACRALELQPDERVFY